MLQITKWGCGRPGRVRYPRPRYTLVIPLSRRKAGCISKVFFFLTFNSKVIPTHIIDPEMDTKTNSRESLETRIANLRPHRCHPRAADVVHTLLSLQLTSFPARAYLLASCLSSTPGSEPTDPYLIDPASHVIRLKKSAAIISTEAKEATRS